MSNREKLIEAYYAARRATNLHNCTAPFEGREWFTMGRAAIGRNGCDGSLLTVYETEPNIYEFRIRYLNGNVNVFTHDVRDVV